MGWTTTCSVMQAGFEDVMMDVALPRGRCRQRTGHSGLPLRGGEQGGEQGRACTPVGNLKLGDGSSGTRSPEL